MDRCIANPNPAECLIQAAKTPQKTKRKRKDNKRTERKEKKRKGNKQ